MFSINRHQTLGQPTRPKFTLFSSNITYDVHKSITRPQLADSAPASDAVKEAANLRELNDTLRDLSIIFPDVQLEVFREMLMSFSPESRLHVITEALLKDKSKHVKGRWRVLPQAEHPPETRSGVSQANPAASIRHDDLFRSEAYKDAVRRALNDEFRNLSRSTIRGVLAERNFSYTESRPILIAINAKSWKTALTTFFTRRKAAEADGSPFIIWRTSASGDQEPLLSHVDNSELAIELEHNLIQPLRDARAQKQIDIDRDIANDLNNLEAEETGALFECGCCFDTISFEHVLACDSHGHYACTRCVQRTVKEALYGQSFDQSVSLEKSTLKCVAISTDPGGRCRGSIPAKNVKRSIESHKGGEEVWQKLEEKMTRTVFAKQNSRILQCPSCPYAELETSAEQKKPRRSQTYVRAQRIAASILGLLILSLTHSDVTCCALSVLFLLTLTPMLYYGGHASRTELQEAEKHTAQRFCDLKSPQGRKFICRNVSCRRVSCLRCLAIWHDIHQCYSSSKQSLRTYVEAAISNAIKRTCPLCSLSFVKDSGCNKLVCQCGYKMCYLCRADVRREGYNHFCPHFRPHGGPCTSCERCDLYKNEDEDVVVNKAREAAEKEWFENEGMGLTKESIIDDDAYSKMGFLKRAKGRRK